MELFISEAEIEDASMIIDYLNQVGGESNNLTYGLNECYLNNSNSIICGIDYNIYFDNIFYFICSTIRFNLMCAKSHKC